MEVAVELEDDLFFADLSKQISLLIMDDDEPAVTACPSVSFQFQTFSRANYPGGPCPSVYLQDQICRSSKGTGVFIPRSSQPTRRNHHHHHHKQGRNTSFSSKTNGQRGDNSTQMVSLSQASSYNNSFYTRKP